MSKLTFESKKNSVDILFNDEYMSIASIDIMHEDDEIEDCNRNMCHFSHDSILKSMDTFYNRPIVYRLNKLGDKLPVDVASHAKNEEDWNNMQVGGHIPTDARITFHTRDNGKTYCNVEALIQKRYMPILMDILKDRDGQVDVSIEIDPIEAYQDKDTGILYIEKFKLLGVCLLGENVVPGMEGAHLEMLTFDKNDIEDLNKKYIEFSYNNTNIIEKIKYKKKNFEKGGTMEHRELEHKLWQILSHKTFTLGKEEMQKYYIEAIYDTHIIVHDNEKDEYFKMKFHIDKDGNVELDMDSAKPLEEDLRKFELEKEFAKEDIGTKDAIKLNKKELKETPWGQIDKAELRKRVIEAKNFKTIAPEIFLDLREGWEEGKMGALKYPVMEIEGDTAYYNRGALASAKGYAEKNNEEEVLAKLRKIYEKLDLEFEEKENGNKVMMEKEHGEDCDCEECKNNECHDEVNNECHNECDETINNEKDEIEEPHAGAQDDKDKKDAKDDEEVRKDDVKKDIEMSADSNVDPSAIAKIEEEQAKDNQELAREENPEIAKMAEENNALIKKIEEMSMELEELRKFKADKEEKDKEVIVNTLLVEVKDVLPEEIFNEFVGSAKEYNLGNITEWENTVKAKAFEYSGKTKKVVSKGYTRIGIWNNETKTKESPKSIWDI